MIEAATTLTYRTAFERAHSERAQAVRAFLALLRQPFRSVTWPQALTRRLHPQPQGCPAGQ